MPLIETLVNLPAEPTMELVSMRSRDIRPVADLSTGDSFT